MPKKPKTFEELEAEADELEIYLPARKEDLSVAQRRQYEKEDAERRAAESTPEGQREMQRGWDEFIVGWNYWRRLSTYSVQEFVILRHTSDPRKFEAESGNFPGGEPPTLGDRVADEVRMIQADPTVSKLERMSLAGWVTWARKNSLSIPDFILSSIAAGAEAQRKLGISPKEFIAKHEKKVRGGREYLDRWFKGVKRKAGEETQAKQFQLGRGRYDEDAMIMALKELGRFSELGS